MTTEQTPPVLTAEDLQALKRADGVVFQYAAKESTIRAIRETHTYGDTPPVYTATEQRLFPKTDRSRGREREIKVGVRMFGYRYGDRDRSLADGWNLDSNPGATAFEYIQSAQFTPAWCTVVGLLRTGDALTLEWAADCGNQYVSGAGLHHDELRLIVERGKNRLTFHLDISVCADNSARMIKRNGG